MDGNMEGFKCYLLENDRSELTVNGYCNDVKVFSDWYNDHFHGLFTIDQLSTTLVRQFKEFMIKEGKKPQTINRRIAGLSVYADWAMQTGLLKSSRNPLHGIKKTQQSPLAPRWLTEKQKAQILRAIEKDLENAMVHYPKLKVIHIRDAAIVRLLLHTGLRVSEVITLQLSDVTFTDRNGSLIVRDGKGGKRREIPLNKEARQAIKSYLKVRPQIDIEYLFIDKNDSSVTEKTVRRSVNRFANLAGLKNVTVHTLRHTFAKNLIDRGVSIDKVAILLGHASLNTTRLYIIPSEQDLEESVLCLEDE